MRETVNYILEANLGLVLFILTYKLLLSNETNFRFSRIFLLFAITLSLILPFFSITNSSDQYIGEVSTLPANWFPEIIISAGENTAPMVTTNTAYDIWRLIFWMYTIGIVVAATLLAFQIVRIISLLKKPNYKYNGFYIVESEKDIPSFSFFNRIFIGNKNRLSENDKKQIIAHEAVHAHQLHSFDILFITALQILFWFNPIIIFYKKAFVHLHEFEADSRAVDNSHVDNYCSLLARLALESAHFPIASHFNQSLTLKRITMIRTIKRNIRPWKFPMLAGIVVASFYLVSCHDQISNEIQNSTITQTGDYPVIVKKDMDAYLRENKEAKLTYMEGLPSEIDQLTTKLAGQKYVVKAYDISSGGLQKKGVLLQEVTQFADRLATDKNVFVIVEQQPEYIGGYNALKEFMQQNMKYPDDALKAGKSGTVYVSIIINADGTTSETSIVKGVYPSLDSEALRVVSMLPKWKPGMQNGQAVACRFILPVKWEANLNANPIPASEITPVQSRMNISSSKITEAGKTIIEGTVTTAEGKSLVGANILIKGMSKGTTTDEKGYFKIEVPSEKGELAISFIGYEFKTISF